MFFSLSLAQRSAQGSGVVRKPKQREVEGGIHQWKDGGIPADLEEEVMGSNAVGAVNALRIHQ